MLNFYEDDNKNTKKQIDLELIREEEDPDEDAIYI
jgi:hypothetical protein